MMQIVVRTYKNIDGSQSHFVHAHDNEGMLIDVLEVVTNGPKVNRITSILP